MKQIVLIIALYISSLSVYAQQADSSVIAEQYYQQGNYQESAALYQRLVDNGKESTALYYNLGNSYYKMEENTKAILYYERALLLSPSDDAVRYNLKMAQQGIVDKIEVLPEFFLVTWYKNFVNLFSADWWGYLSLVFFVVFFIFIGLFLFTSSSRGKKNGFVGGIVAIIITGCCLYFGYLQNNKIANSSYAIVMTPSVVVRGAPDRSGTDLFVVHEGLKVEVLERVSGWYNIRLADGNEGWVEERDVEKI